MKNKDQWIPSKYVYKKNKLVHSPDSREVSVGSRLITDIIAQLYETYLPQYAKGTLIDLGCGKVPLYHAYRQFITDNVCVDWADTIHKNIYLDLECDLTQKLPFDDAQFDTIILSDVLEHIPNPGNLWSEMTRILKDKGILFINVPFFYWLHEMPHDYYRYTESALRRFAELSGCDVLVLKPLGGMLEILADFISKNIQYFPVIGIPLSKLIQSVAFCFYKTRLGKLVMTKTSLRFPLGYFMVAEKKTGS